MSEIKKLREVIKDANKVSDCFNKAIEMDYEEVFIVGVKDGMIHTSWSAYKNIAQKVGQLEMLKINIINGGN